MTLAKSIHDELMNSMFHQSMDLVLNFTSHWIIIICSLILSTVYYTHSTYYTMGNPLSHFSLMYFMFDKNSTVSHLDLELLVMIIYVIMNGFTLKYFYKIKCDLNKFQQVHHSSIDTVHVDNVHRQQESLLDSKPLLKSESKHKKANWNINSNAAPLCTVVFYVSLYVTSLMATILYIMTEYLPNNNKLGINHNWLRYLIRYSIAFIVTTTSIFLSPKVVDSIYEYYYNYCDIKYNHSYGSNAYDSNRTAMIMMVRSISTIIVPFIVSVMMLDDCGSMWSLLWNECNSPNSFTIVKHFSALYEPLFTHNDICGLNNLFDGNVLLNVKDNYLIGGHH